MDNINYNDFHNICRTCLLTCDNRFLQDHVTYDVYYKLTERPWDLHDELPQQICHKCYEKIIEMHEFSLQCKQAYSNLTKCLNEFKNLQIKVEDVHETSEFVRIKEEITIEEHKIEFDNDEEYITNENIIIEQLEIKTENTEQSDEISNYQNINSVQDDTSLGCSVNSVKSEQYVLRQFQKFCLVRNYQLNENTTNEELAQILKDWAFNMRKNDGSEYKEGVVKTIWNRTAKIVQQKYFKEFHRTFNPFKDIDFQSAVLAKNAKRKYLQANPSNRKSSAVLNPEDIPSTMRWGDVNEEKIKERIKKSIPKSTVKNKNSQWRQFMSFCETKQVTLSSNTSIAELAVVLKNWALNMRKQDGTDYKEGVIKTLWNNAAKMLQEKYFNEYKIKFNPFEDVEFTEARNARDSKRKELQCIPTKRKVSAKAFTIEEHSRMQKIWDENTPEGLQKKFYIIASRELAWKGSLEAVYLKTSYFQIEVTQSGIPTGRIRYNQLGSNSKSKWLIANVDKDICPVRLYYKLIEKRPKNITTDRFFLTPNPNWLLNSSAGWFKTSPVGRNTLSKWTRETAKKIGLDTANQKFTNLW